jgi:hypothetical protein
MLLILSSQRNAEGRVVYDSLTIVFKVSACIRCVATIFSGL